MERALLPLLLSAFTVTGAACGIRHVSPKKRCQANVWSIKLALEAYFLDTGEYPPSLAALASVSRSGHRTFGPYLTTFALTCPHIRKYVRPYAGPATDDIPDAHISYCYVAGLRPDDPSHYILLFDEERNHRYSRPTSQLGYDVQVLYVNGSAEYVEDIAALHAALQEQLKELGSQGRSVELVRPSWSNYPAPPTYPSRPWHEEPAIIAVLVVVGAALIAAAVKVARRRRVEHPPRAV